MKKYCLFMYGLFSIGIAHAQYTVLHNFNDTNGAPTGDLTLVGKMLYGMTNVREVQSPRRGSVFSMDTNGNNYRILHEFDSTPNYVNHYGSLTYAAGVLYGTTCEGGANRKGTIFSIDTNGNNYKDMFDFDSIHGSYPSGSLTLLGKKLYGMTWEGGRFLVGCIFSIDTDGSGYQDLFDFPGSFIGGEPFGALTISGKMMYGMASDFGFYGNVFSVDTDGSNYKNLYSLNYGLGGGDPHGSLTLSNGVLYGMTTKGGNGPDFGCIFSIDTNGNSYRDMLDFAGRVNGNTPYGSLTLAGSTLYGMALGGNTGSGVVFSIDTDSKGYKNMFEFDYNGDNGEGPLGSLTLSGSTLYGMTSEGGTNGYGVIFKIDTDAVAGINNLSGNKKAVKVYPNPSNGQFTLSVSNVNTACNVEIYNELGENIYKSKINSDNTEINVSGQPNGVYLYRVISENGELVGQGKLIVQ